MTADAGTDIEPLLAAGLVLLLGAEADVLTLTQRLRAARLDVQLAPPLALAAVDLRAVTDTPPATGLVLTPRESDIAALIADGLQNNEIAFRLNLSPATVRTHLRHIFRRLGIANRAQLAAWITDHPPTVAPSHE
jgi:DNA-binding NarL/FixJ family response regulator